MSRLIARITHTEVFNNRQRLAVRRDGAELRLSLAGAGGIGLSLAYANDRDAPPVFARGSDAQAIEAVCDWLVRGGCRVVKIEEAPPEPAAAGADGAEYRRGLEAALALCNERPTAHAFSVAAEILALLGRPIKTEAPARRRAPRRKPAGVPA